MSADPVTQVLDAVRAGDPESVRSSLHPYLHWTEGDRVLRGRRNVLSLLAGRSSLAPPDSVELRDGQIYRWTGPPSLGG